MTEAKKTIDELTPDQEEMLQRIRDEWYEIGLSTEPADWETAKRGVRMAYDAAKLAQPAFIVCQPSPWAGAVAQAVMPEIATRGIRQRDTLMAMVDRTLDAFASSVR